MQARKYIKYLFFFSVFILSLMVTQLGKTVVLISDFINILLLCCLFYNKHKLSSVITLLGKNICIIFILLIALGIISSLINFIQPITTLWGVRTFYRYAIYFVSCIVFLNIRDCIYYEKWLRNILLVNFFFSTIQFFLLNQIGDINSGTLSGNGGLYVLCYVCLTYYIISYIYQRITLKTMAIYLSLVLFIAIFAELKIVFLLIPATYGLCILLAKKTKNSFKSILFVTVFCVVGLSVIAVFQGDRYVEALTNKDDLIEYSTRKGGYNFTEEGINRGIALELTDNLFYSDNSIQRYLGMGIGTGSASPIIASPFFQRYGRTLSYHFFMTSYLLIEQGWIGFILYVVLWIFILLRLKVMKLHDDFYMFWRTFGIVLTIQILVSIWYNASLVLDDVWFLFLYLAIPFIYYKHCQINAMQTKPTKSDSKEEFNNPILF